MGWLISPNNPVLSGFVCGRQWGCLSITFGQMGSNTFRYLQLGSLSSPYRKFYKVSFLWPYFVLSSPPIMVRHIKEKPLSLAMAALGRAL